MNDALNALGAFFDALLVWLRVTNTFGFPTVSHGELLYTPFIVAAFLWRLTTVISMTLLLRSLERDGKDKDLGDSARERLQRAQRGMLRIGTWGFICWALLTNYEYSTVAFVFGFFWYAVIENVDGFLGWKYQQDRRRYWKARDAMDDYAERLATLARIAAEHAEASAVDQRRQGNRIEASLEETKALVREGTAQSARAEEVSNGVNEKIATIGHGIVEGRRQDRADVESIKETTAEIKHIAAETHAIVSNTLDGGKEDTNGQ